MIDFSVLNWNIGGAKYFLEKSGEREQFRKDLNESLAQLVEYNKPDVITLQEIAATKLSGDKEWTNVVRPIKGYSFHKEYLIDSIHHEHVYKWEKIREEGEWKEKSGERKTHFAQGIGILMKDDLIHTPVWQINSSSLKKQKGTNSVELIQLTSGLYFGDRNTEPRAALVSHFVFEKDPKTKTRLNKPLDVFVINTHLATLKGEREGIPQIDHEAIEIRSIQIDSIFKGIISRYNDWRRKDYQFSGDKKESSTKKKDRHPPVWIIAGDFNFTPASGEYEQIILSNFVDLCPHKGNC